MPRVSLNPTITQNVIKMKNDIAYSALMGKYKDYKNARIAYAKFAIDNFEQCKNSPSPSIKAPIFSKFGFNMLKVWLLDKFRIKTKDEKLFNKMALEEKAKQKILNG